MLRSRIIPSLLLQDGGLVKTVKFSEEKYIGDPINAVRIFNEKEVDELCLFDIGIKGSVTRPDFGLLEKISQEATMPLCYGGGVNSAKDAIKLEKFANNAESRAQHNLTQAKSRNQYLESKKKLEEAQRTLY